MNADARRLKYVLLALALINLRSSAFICGSIAWADDPKPKVAVFPLGGDTSDDARDKVGFSLRAKLDRDGTYEVIDGYTMKDAAGETAITAKTKLDDIEKLAKDQDADVMIWGQLDKAADGMSLHVKVFDNRQLDPLPHDFTKEIHQPTDMRFVVEDILQTLQDVKPFEHPSEEPVTHDATAEKLWASNPNLVVNGTFDKADNWAGIYQAEKYTVKFLDSLPAVDKIAIYRMPDDGKINNVLAMNLSKNAAENNGLACLSDAIKIEPNTRYRLSFRYQSDGPRLHVFVKGYTMGKNVTGNVVEREIYRRQVPPTGKTDGDWVTIVDEMNPQSPSGQVQFLRIDLYAYLSPGVVMFDDVVLKAVGAQTRHAHDDAIKPPATRP